MRDACEGVARLHPVGPDQRLAIGDRRIDGSGLDERAIGGERAIDLRRQVAAEAGHGAQIAVDRSGRAVGDTLGTTLDARDAAAKGDSWLAAGAGRVADRAARGADVEVA